MQWLIYKVIEILFNTFFIITIIDIFLMGKLSIAFSGKCRIPRFVIQKRNRIDIQQGNECAGYATAYLLRHFDIPVAGDEIYAKISRKLSDGCVFPKGVKKYLKDTDSV